MTKDSGAGGGKKTARAPVVVGADPLMVLSAYDKGVYDAEKAAKLLNVSRATFFRRYKRWKETGQVPLHGNRGRSPSNKVPDDIERKVIELIKTKYHDFQASLMRTYLSEYDDICVSTEWLRRLIVRLRPEETPRERRQSAHRLRRRRTSRGALVQIDGSPYQWFEGDLKYYCLIIFVDDATGEILAAGFSETETKEAYVAVLKKEILRNGLPMSLYSDRHSIFTVSDPLGRKGKISLTQFQRICEHLGIELILAHSPEAKGRVERAFRTLQGRWPKEFRVMGIKNMAEANERIDEFVEAYNREFAIAPADSEDSHIAMTEEDKNHLDVICATWHRKTISRNLTVSNRKQVLQIVGVAGKSRQRMAKTDVHLVEFPDEHVELYWHDRKAWEQQCLAEGRKVRKVYQKLEFKEHDRYDLKPKLQDYEEPPEETSKTIDHRVDEIERKKKAKGYSWASSMSSWADNATAKRQKKEREAEAVRARIAAAKAAAKKN